MIACFSVDGQQKGSLTLTTPLTFRNQLSGFNISSANTHTHAHAHGNTQIHERRAQTCSLSGYLIFHPASGQD